MAESAGSSGARALGDYLVGKQIGSGSFSVVWHAKHRVHGTEVAIKEIAMGRLNKKLQESLMSEIFILKQIIHPNIIRLHDIIEAPGKIHLVLEYCKGGDLSVYVQHRGKVPEVIAKHLMQQLAAGLKVLRDNNLIHRDLKPQNLLLSSSDDNSVLKIADFGFARSLQPMGLAETLCGSPLYMAPEIMQLQKYDAKADLWSVGAILFQFVTGRPPFNGNNQIQLLQNILKATELHFPPDCQDLSYECIDLCQRLLRRNPVERLTFEEFFDHPFLSHSQVQTSKTLSNRRSTMILDTVSSSERNPDRKTEDFSQEECCGPDGAQRRRSTMKTTYGFSLDPELDRREEVCRSTGKNDGASTYGTDHQTAESKHGSGGPLQLDQRSTNSQSGVVDSMEWIVRDYVLVSGPPIDMSSSSVCASKPSHLSYKPESPQASENTNTVLSASILNVGVEASKTGRIEDVTTQSSAPGTSQGSMDAEDALEPSSIHCMMRIRSLQQSASVITELVNEKVDLDLLNCGVWGD